MASILTVLYTINSQETVLTLKEDSVIAPLPPVYLCPHKQISSAQRTSVEKLLPVMKDLWPVWDQLTIGEDPLEHLLPWGNNTKSVEQMREVIYEGGRFTKIMMVMKINNHTEKVMYEGVLLALPSCSSILSSCGEQGESEECCKSSRPVHTLAGPCLKLGSSPFSSFPPALFSLLSMHSLNLTVEIDSVNSPRIGHPVISAAYWGHSYLCDSQWSDKEAEVMCKSMGFNGGRRHKKVKPTLGLTNSMARFARFLGKFQCSGSESVLGECLRTEYAGCGLGEEEEVSTLLCDPGGLQHNGLPDAGTRGFAYLKVRPLILFLQDFFGP